MYSLLLSLAAILIATKLLGELARRMGQPSVVGELVAGVLLGGSALGLVDPHEPAVRALAEFGLFVLMFQAGIHTDVRTVKRAGLSAMMSGAAGAILPFLGGFFVAHALGVPVIGAVVAGASLVSVSMAISARILGDNGVLHTREGQIVVGAALADGAISLVIIAIVVSLGGAAASTSSAGRALAISAVFIAAWLAVGRYVGPPIFRLLDGIRAKGSLGLFGMAFGLLLAVIAAAVGSATIIGAFVGGVILHPTPQRQEIERTTAQIGHFFIPIFFAAVGASLDVHALVSPHAAALGAALVTIGIAGKVIAGYAPWDFSGNKLLIGVAMVPRGEIGLIFAQMGLAAGAITPEMFGAIVLMAFVTTLVSPPMLRALVRRDESLDREHVEAADPPRTNGRRQTTAGRRH